MPNTNPFLDDSDAISGNTESIASLGNVTERSEKKRRAPMPPQNKAQMGKPDIPPRTMQSFPSRASEDSGDCSLRQDKCPAPLPPEVSKNRQEMQNEHADQSTTPLHIGEWRTTRFQEKDQMDKVCPVSQNESRTSDADNFRNTSLSHLSQSPPSNRQETNPFISTEVKTIKHNKGPAPKPLLQSTSRKNSASEPEPNNLAIRNVRLTEHAVSLIEDGAASNSCIDHLDVSSKQSTGKPNDLPISEKASTKLDSGHSDEHSLRESRQGDLPAKCRLDSLGENVSSRSEPILGKVLCNIENVLPDTDIVSKKKSRAPLPPASSAATSNQNSTSQQPESVLKSTSQPTRQDQDKLLTINSSIPTSCFTPSHESSSPIMNQALKKNEVQIKTEHSPQRVEAGQGSAHRTLPHARVSPIDVKPIIGQNNGSEHERTGDPAFKPCR